MNEPLIIKMGEFAIGTAPRVLTSGGIGSCVVIVLYDPEIRVGGIAHAMLPTTQNEPAASARYVCFAIKSMLADIIQAGAKHERLIAKLIGGAHMFSLYGDVQHSIGTKNLEEAHATLEAEGIPIEGEETGGTVGRNVSFDLSSGVCSVETKM